jgi:MoaA/NifB/PqqE/SkfB family radical SAM enzyme|tara:strand:+ start:10918 stop:12279 length:1362 start_codon:yes stop_codon:yes gene_type:complete
MNTETRQLAIKNLKGSDEKLRIAWMLKNMRENKAFSYLSQRSSSKEKVRLLSQLKNDFKDYRHEWRNNPKLAIKNKLIGEKFNNSKIRPLCIDIEVASVCDLACPHCYRQFISTPDKIMSKDLAFKLIDQASEIKVPSMKFNWRGEPLLNPSLPEIIDYAKQKGVLETIINTNATKLDENMSRKIINSGLDLLIYSFDGGTKKSYEKMRPGRFKKNNFEEIYNNIKNFSKLKKKMKSSFPRTKIQMVLTDDTFNEQEKYFNLFKDIVDDVSVKQYTERGGKISDIGEEYLKKSTTQDKNITRKFLDIKKVNPDSEVMRDPDGNVFISKGRMPCEQPYQRMLVTYDGRVSMCCYDWGSMHPVGYVDALAIKVGEKSYEEVKKKADLKIKGFELMNLELPKIFNKPEKEVKTIKEIWFGENINHVRTKHSENALEEIKICKNCPFKETYKWEKIN